MKPLPKLNFKAICTTDLEGRNSKVQISDFAKPLKKGLMLREFFQGLPNILAAADLHEAAERIITAKKLGRPIILAMGGHAIKVGLTSIIIDLMERDILDALATNGSVMVHDSEAALVGATSEDVAATLNSGQFGVTEQTGSIINRAARMAAKKNQGLGRTLGENLISLEPPFLNLSLFAATVRLDKIITVHAAVGTDVYNIHPEADGAALGKATMNDFHLFCCLIANLEGGVFINLGSAVIIPEVFLKALTLVRNLGRQIRNITTINMDFIRHYRPQVNIVNRPTQDGGRGFYFIGHHEIMFPLLMALVLEKLD
ncbi:MAG: hypothetical protein LBV77_03210 [Candidatus Adiutrix intracellularis]|jgi:hypothetical protein|nr:hypothetical protein [Candidatus Adiutrix intracellularis]